LVDVADLVRDDRVHGRIYRDAEIFAAELDRIFYRRWVYVAHESEIAATGDYKTTWIGRRPVIVNRAADGHVRVMLNRCRHRASTVCDSRLGTANVFRCPYHGWTYDGTGRLIGVPHRPGYGDDLDVASLGLVSLPRVEECAGFYFASFDSDVEPLVEHLGNARPYLHEIANQGNGAGIVVTHAINQNPYDGNWKLQVENTVDNYHVGFVHRAFLDIMEERSSAPKLAGPQTSGPRTRYLGNGHTALDFRSEGTNLNASGDLPFNLLVFPNLMFVGIQIRVVFPIAADRTLVELIPTAIRGEARETNWARMRVHEDGFGPAGFIGPDDMDVVMRRVPIGLQADGGDDWLLFNRGMGPVTDVGNGIIEGDLSGELAHRGFYARWKELMTCDRV
jgi:phenylpropionate dioxygenase-like ring-hydroxylating dioxygenase large terminal subunit